MPADVHPVYRQCECFKAWYHLALFVTLALATLMALAQNGVANPDGIDIIVDRQQSSIEVYVGGNAETVVALFGADPMLFVDEQGHVPFDQFNEGTWLLGDALLAAVDVESEAASPLDLQAMSLMVHPAGLPVPFTDSIDAVAAISICSVAAPPDDLRLSDARIYVGYIAYTDDPMQRFSFALPDAIAMEGAPVGLQVRDRGDGREVFLDQTVTISDSVIAFSPAPTQNPPSITGPMMRIKLWMLPDLLLALVFGLGVVGAALAVCKRADISA